MMMRRSMALTLRGRSFATSTAACAGRTITSKSSISNLSFPIYGVGIGTTTKNQTRHVFEFHIRAIHQPQLAPEATTKDNDDDARPEPDWKIKMLYDGDCPLCMREVNMLKERNDKYGGAIKFVDISSPDYSPQQNQGLQYETVMGKIHAIMSDGTVVTNVEAFRKLYEAVGLGWIYAITRYEPVATIAEAVYNVWARYRLPLTGRPPLEQVLEARKKNKEGVCNDNSSCKM